MPPRPAAAGAGGDGGGEEPMPSPEEMLALLEMFQQQPGFDANKVPSDLKGLMDAVARSKAGKGGGPAPPEVPTEEITPEPGFVIKTTEVASGRKVFINVCAHPRVAAPGGWSGGVMPDEVAAALDKMQSGGDAALSPSDVEALRFPLSCGPPRAEADRKGAPCAVVDVALNDDVLRAAGAARKLKALVIEVCLGWVGAKLGGPGGPPVELDARYKLPRMRYKGEVVAPQRIRADDKRKALVTELRDVDEEPAFALRTKKAPPPPPPPQQQQQQQQQQQPASTAAPGGPQQAAAPGKAAGGGTAAAAPAAAPAGAASSSAAASASAAAAAGGGGGEGGPTWRVEYEGRPVEGVRITVHVPPQPGGPAPTPEGVGVEVAGRSAWVRLPGRPQLHVPLLFAAAAEGGSAEWQPGGSAGGVSSSSSGGVLVVRLPYQPLDAFLADARAQAPLAFGQLGFASTALLELEP